MIGGIWRERIWWWSVPLALLLANLVAMGWFQLTYSGTAQSVDQLVERRSTQAAKLTEVVRRQRRVVARVSRNEQQVRAFYDSRLATSQERLTEIMREVRSLVATAGLAPSSITYPEDELEEFGLERRGVNFGVEGSYINLRRLMNLLELSDSFLTLEEVNLSGRGAEGNLRITLRLSTLFSTQDRPREGREESAS